MQKLKYRLRMLEMPKESLEIQRIVACAMSRHTFTMVGPSKRGVENQEIATGVGVKWKGQHLILTAGHVVDYCPEDTLRFFLPARDIQFAPAGAWTSRRRGTTEAI